MTLRDDIRILQRKLNITPDGVPGPITIAHAIAAVDERDALKARTGSPQAEGTQGLSNAVSAAGGHSGGPDGAFERALPVILRHEGGFVNHPRDPGGMTNLGVTKATWEGWTGKPATEADMRALTVDAVAPLYRKNYWDKLRGDELPPALALCVFDFGVNAGPSRAARYLQRLVGAAEDGEIGGATLAAVRAWVARVGEAEAVRAYQEARRGYYRQLSTFATFGRGWLRRVDETEAEARKWT